jgi:PEP-CTERM motif.
MLVKNQNNNANERISFLRFDGSELTAGNVESASLDLKIASFSNKANMTLQLFGIPDDGFNEAFDAATITYANSGYTTIDEPDNNVLDDLLFGGAPLATFSLLNSANVGDTISFSGAGLVDFLNANNNSDITFLITTSTIHDQVYLGLGTVENLGNEPVLNYTTAVPEPSSMTLAALGGLALLRLRRSRN